MLSLDRFKGKVAVVTGSSSGCGASISKSLATQGLVVVGLARRKDRLLQLEEQLKGKGRFIPYECDVSKINQVTEAFDWINKNVGPVHVLVNNAGITRPSTLIDGEPEDWKAVFDTNVLGLCVATKCAVNQMKECHVDGHVIHINSFLGHYVLHVPEMNAYPASKFAVTALTETLRQELNAIGSKIRISSISPGAIETEFFAQRGSTLTQDVFQEYVKQIPMLAPEDVANAVVFVLSNPPNVLVQELMLRTVGEPV